MRRISIVLAITLAGACARHTRPDSRPGVNVLRQVRQGPARVVARTASDSAVIQRICVAPDSVLSGLADCVLRNQASFRTF